MSTPSSPLLARLGAVLLIQLALLVGAVAPQLSARGMGEEYLLRVAPVDPIDPFRGAYVDLDYPDLRLDDELPRSDDRDTVFVTLVDDGGVLVATSVTYTRPATSPYLTCDADAWRTRCGIESLFVPQDEAQRLEEAVATGEMVARVRIDSRGHAALLGVEDR